jgi:hypothetical protein
MWHCQLLGLDHLIFRVRHWKQLDHLSAALHTVTLQHVSEVQYPRTYPPNRILMSNVDVSAKDSRKLCKQPAIILSGWLMKKP